ncbi:MAG: tRNA-dihydrouridine synthase, partial [Clostridia bacterium]|nr:tRNA-dihydrouridine synthase [Clostridia bacterium]
MTKTIEMAPLEGSTTSFFRRMQSRHFAVADKYFTPFISPTQNHSFTNRELREILPEMNEGLNVVPQLIGHNADDFLWATNELKEMGYKEVNLNLGCPSATVTKKKKGAGLLGDIPMLT